MKLLDIKNNSMIKAIIGVALLSSSAVAAPAIWDGTADVSWYESSAQTYNLTTAEQLAGLAKLVNDGTSSFEGKTITLGADIFLNDTAGAGDGTWASIEKRSWTPIGTSTCPFKGEFDGLAGKKNRKIYGLYINDEKKNHAGFFGYTSGVKINNLDLLIGVVTAKDNVGALTGYALTGSVTNVHSEIKVTGKNHVGGLIGYYTGDISKSSVQENVVGQDSVGGLVGYTSGAITGTANANSYFVGDVSGRKYVGGLVGLGTNISNGYAKGTVSGSSSYVGGGGGDVIGTVISVWHIDGKISGESYVGGVVGHAKNYVSSSYSEGDVVGTGSYVGGVVGYTDGFVSSSHSEGAVKGKSLVGGIAGYAGSTIGNSYSKGNIIGTKDWIGGIVGETKGAVSSSYSEGDVVGKYGVGGVVGYTDGPVLSSHSEGDVRGETCVGGVAGASDNIIRDSYSKGDVSGTKRSVGGVVGSGKMVSSSFSEGNIKGVSNVGGIAGDVDSTIENSYSKGNIIGTKNCIGGIVGWTAGVVFSSYSEGNVIGSGDYVGGLAGMTFSRDKCKYVSIIQELPNVSFDIVKDSYSIGDVKGRNYVGGALGFDSISCSQDSRPAMVRNFTNVNATGSVEGFSYVGGIIGKMNYSFKGGDPEYNEPRYQANIDSSVHKGDVIGKEHYVGGIAGYIYGIIKNSHSEGDVIGSGDYIGGLIGMSYSYCFILYIDELGSGFVIAQPNVVINSYSIGNIMGANYVGGVIGLDSVWNARPDFIRKVSNVNAQGSVEGKNYVGGVIGKMSLGYYLGMFETNDKYYRNKIFGKSEISYCHHTKGDVLGDNYVGGIVGAIDGSITHSHSEGNVSGIGDCVGGVVGLSLRRVCTSNYHPNDTTYIKNVYSVGNVKGLNYVGGLIGLDSTHKLLNNCSVTKKGIVRTISQSYSKGNVEGASFVGGLIGSQNIGSDSSNKYVSGNYIHSEINLNYHSDGNVLADSSYVGGLIGYAHCNIESSFHETGSIKGQKFVGGVAGYVTGSISRSHSDGDVIGMSDYVGGISGYSIDSLNAVYHKKGSVGGCNYVGGVVGYATRTITSSHSEGGIIGKGRNIGGLAGFGSIAFSYHTEGDVSGTGNYVGGLTGSGTVDSSYHIGGDISSDGSYVGGLTGNGSVSNSYSEGNVAGLDYVGGVAGSSTKIRNSNAKADYVKGRNSVGGLAGYVTDSIDVSYFEGDSVTGIFQVGGLAGYAKSAVDSSHSTANVKGDDNVGGLIGSAYGDVSNSYALGNVDGDVDNSSAGNDNLGGLVGYQYSGSVSKSMALGHITGTTKLGGLVGRFDGTSISNSYANGNVTGSYYGDPADEVGNYYIGGLVGYAKGSLNETYSSGIVKGMDEDPVYTGCMVGYVNGSLSVANSYYDKSKCDLGIDGGEESVTLAGTPDKTTAEMQTQSTFEDWDFVDTWKIIDDTYPFLQIYSNSLTNAVVTTQSLEGINYDGTAKTPLVTSVKLFGQTLEYETEYTIAYANNVNAGTASINVCGVKPYGGCKVVNFEIAGIVIKPTIAAIENMTYTGRALTPEVKVYNGETLLASTDYNVEYKNNVNAGTATVVAIMNGNYSGTASKTFTIEKATPEVYQTPKASDVIVGQTLEFSELTSGSANVEGTFVWKIPGSKPTLENEGYAVVFVPADTANYTNSEEIVVPIKVLDMAYVAVHAGIITIDSMLILKGSSYALPNAPDSVGYDFVGFYQGETLIGNVGDEITISENTVIDAVYKIKTFIVTFMNGSTVLQSGEVAYGVVPIAPKVTLPENTAQYTYSFGGWDKEIVAVTKAATYNAVIDSVVNKYQVVFKDYDGTVLKDSLYAYGTLGSEIVMPADTVRATTAQYTYIFKGWTPEIDDVTKDAAYTAQYDSTVNVYEISFVILNDILQSTKKDLAYGTVPVYEGMPTRASTAQYSYAFKGWSPEIVSVSGVATYTAVFDSVVNKYEVTFKNGDEVLQSSEYEYGTMPNSPDVPLPENTAQYIYSFAGWDKEIVAVTGPVTYTAVITNALGKYQVTFKDYDGSILMDAKEYDYGTAVKDIVKPTNPARASTAQYTYTFKGWTPEVSEVKKDVEYVAEYDSTLRNYMITFVNGSEELQKSEIDYGKTPVYEGKTPVKEATARYTYIFKGWTPIITSVVGNAAYAAVFDSVVNKYEVTFKNGDEVLQSSEYEYGTIPNSPDVPLPENTAQYIYSFAGWDKEIVAVTGSVTYTAVITNALGKYQVTFKDYDGSILMDAKEYDYGTAVKDIVKPTNPARASTAQYTYTFKGWTPEISEVKNDVEYVADYNRILRNYSITFVNGSEELQKSEIDYGKTPVYEGKTPVKDASVQYTYTFKGWTPSIKSVSGLATYKAVFDSIARKYAFVFKNGDVVLAKGEVAYGVKPKYSGKTPTKPETDSCTYVFSGWSPELKPTDGEAVYTAQFEIVKKTFTVRFTNRINNRNTLLEKITVSYGEMPEYTGETPTKKSSANYTYEFAGWSPSISAVKQDAEYKAVFDSTKITGMADSRLVNMEMSVNVISRNIQVSAAPMGSVYAILDVQGRVLQKGIVETANFNIAIRRAGSYLVQVGNRTRRVDVK